MKICPNCGAELTDGAAFCTYCGSSVATTDNMTQGAFSGQAQYQSAPQMQAQPQMQTQEQTVKGFDPAAYAQTQAQAQMQGQVQAQPQPTGGVQYYTYHDNPAADYKRDEGLVTAIKVFLIIGCVLSINFFCIPLIWKIPMTIHAFKKLNNNEAMGTGFKVCTLLFVNLIAGIMMFIIKDEDMPFDRI